MSESESGDLETRLADLSRRIDRRAKEFERRGEFSDIRRATMKDILKIVEESDKVLTF